MRYSILTLLLAASCVQLTPPKGFVRMERWDTDFAATAADGSKLLMQKVVNQPEAPPEFWQEVVDRDLESRGYSRVENGSAEIKGSQLEGRVQEYSTSVGDTAFRYVVALFVKGTTVHTVRFGCEEGSYEKHKPAVYDWIKNYAGSK